ncbi:very short patch repair endonuclease [Methylorubrum extorquens]|uniref:very short patch repair endonuclease n=1 Tax=Methylorubrum extorquens TaxID=408 RepID=UPI0020A13531
MSRIRGRDTKPELILRKSLHAAGFRYRIHARELPGRPDIVFPRYRAAIFVHGCFWHGHNCPMFKLPSTRQEFWSTKIIGNRQRDQRKATELKSAGWRILTIWECSLTGPARRPPDELTACCSEFLKSNDLYCELSGNWRNRR